MAETKTGAPNIQDVFLNYARREKLPVTIHLLDNREFEARIKNFDRFALIVEHGGMDHLIFKHAISNVSLPRGGMHRGPRPPMGDRDQRGGYGERPHDRPPEHRGYAPDRGAPPHHDDTQEPTEEGE